MIVDIEKAFLQIAVPKNIETLFDFCGKMTLKTLILIIYSQLN